MTLGDGIDHLCQIVRKTADTVELYIISSSPNTAELAQSVTLFQGRDKGLGWTVKKAVELGVSRIVPFVSEFTVAECNEAKAERLTKIAQYRQT